VLFRHFHVVQGSARHQLLTLFILPHFLPSTFVLRRFS
jgi:hypothetical protein